MWSGPGREISDLTPEYQVKGEFADYGLRIDKDLVGFIETKRATTKLAPKHLRQVEMYAVNEGGRMADPHEWVRLAGLPPHRPVYLLSLASALLSESVVAALRRELRRKTGQTIERERANSRAARGGPPAGMF